jgi:copper chaperone CopZ
MAVTSTYTVSGMTCSHCVQAVTVELSALPGVADVRVDLTSGAVTVTSEAPLTDDQVRAAVDEAGYDLASA